jgi:hypothetical protein
MTDERTVSETNIQTIVDKTIRKANIVMDATLLTTLMSCPCLADFRFNHNFQSIKGKSNSLECGSIVHKFMEVYYGTIAKGISRKEAFGYGMAAAETYIKGCPICTGFISTPEQPKPSCGHRKDDYPGVENTPPESEGYRTGWKWVLTTCEQYHEYYKNDFWVPLETEVVKSEVLYEDSEIRVLWKAKLDLTADTNQGIYPIDHKTMKQNRPNLNLNNQFTGQCLIMKTRNVIINKVGFQKTLKPEEKFLRHPVSYTPQRLIEWQSEILPYYAYQLLAYAEANHWPRNYTSCEGKYGNCAFAGVCGANPDMREEELKLNFKVGEPWNPTNEDEGD